MIEPPTRVEDQITPVIIQWVVPESTMFFIVVVVTVLDTLCILNLSRLVVERTHTLHTISTYLHTIHCIASFAAYHE